MTPKHESTFRLSIGLIAAMGALIGLLKVVAILSRGI